MPPTPENMIRTPVKESNWRNLPALIEEGERPERKKDGSDSAGNMKESNSKNSGKGKTSGSEIGKSRDYKRKNLRGKIFGKNIDNSKSRENSGKGRNGDNGRKSTGSQSKRRSKSKSKSLSRSGEIQIEDAVTISSEDSSIDGEDAISEDDDYIIELSHESDINQEEANISHVLHNLSIGNLTEAIATQQRLKDGMSCSFCLLRNS